MDKLLPIGALVFFLTHMIPLQPVNRRRLVGLMGEPAYRATISVLAVIGLGLMIAGFALTPRMDAIQMPAWGVYLPAIMMPFAFILVVSAYLPTNIRRYTWHPMIIGVLLWAVAHVLASPYSNSALFFGCFGLYGMFSLVIAILRGKPQDLPPPLPFSKDLIVIGMGLLAYVAMTAGHHILFGVSALPFIFGGSAATVAPPG